MMEALLSQLSDYGAIGLVLAFVLWQNNRITNRLFQVIEDNSKVLSELKSVIESSVERRKS